MPEYFKKKASELNVDLSYLRDVSSGSNEFMVEMIELFLEQTPVYFEQIGNALAISSSRNKYTLEQLVKGSTKRNRHKLIFPNHKRRGKEAW